MPEKLIIFFLRSTKLLVLVGDSGSYFRIEPRAGSPAFRHECPCARLDHSSAKHRRQRADGRTDVQRVMWSGVEYRSGTAEKCQIRMEERMVEDAGQAANVWGM